jgi:hypothetical protein
MDSCLKLGNVKPLSKKRGRHLMLLAVESCAKAGVFKHVDNSKSSMSVYLEMWDLKKKVQREAALDGKW